MIKLILEGHSWSLPYHIEARFRYIISEQEAYGWKIDVELMDRLLVELDERRGSIRGEALELIPLRVIDQGEVKKVFKKDGDMTAHVEKWYNNLECRMFRLTDVVGCFSRVDFQVTNLESPIQRITALEKQGWKPTEWNYKTDAHNKPIYDEKGNKIKTSPKLTQDSVEECEVGKLMIEYLTVSHRFKLVSGLRDRLREDNRIGSGGITVGCNTGRMMHRNIVNIPRVGELYGEQVRSLFSSEEGHILVGADLKSLENRLIGHFTHPFDNGEYAKRLEEEDSHDTTVKLVAPYMSITRNMAKTCVPLDTQILTRRGWKLYNEVIIGEDVLAYDPETKTKKWTPLLDTTVLEDEVLEYRDKCRTFRATANHKWFVTQRSRAKNSFKRPYRTHQLRTTKDLTCDSSLITNAPMAEDQDLVSKCSRGLTYKKYNFNWVERVLQMSQTERSRFLEGFLIADGYESSNSWQFSQKTGELQEAALLCSYLVHHSTIRTNDRLCPNGNVLKIIYLSQKNTITTQKQHFHPLGKQKVWCPTTKYGSWVMRQENFISITGNCNYALGFGAGIGKVAEILECDLKFAKKIHKIWWDDKKAMVDLKKAISRSLLGRGQLEGNKLKPNAWIKGLDGRKIYVRSAYSIINALIQNAGAVVTKFITCSVYKLLKEHEVPAHLVCVYHDEINIEVEDNPVAIEHVKQFINKSVDKCNKYFKLRIPMEMDIKVGASWAKVH